MPDLFADLSHRLRKLAAARQPARGSIRGVLAVLAASLVLSACASVPSQEMSDARRALDAAEQADARRLLPLAMKRASTTLDNANSALRAGQYDEARQLALDAREEAIAVRVLAARSERVRVGIVAARAQGRAWQPIDELMQRAIAMSRKGDLKGALSVSKKVLEMLP